ELFFTTLDSHVMVAGYTVKGESFAADKPRQWLEKKVGGMAMGGGKNYDLAPDGKRIAALMPVETPETPGAQQTQNHVVFLMNFADELQRKVPLGK
ncbi:MAG: hypothetical protein LV481_16260, partial [Methylacidiphilales bacterium]|nr:hypothetical protein [Candidatus Methylacidiphilales bacterium]